MLALLAILTNVAVTVVARSGQIPITVDKGNVLGGLLASGCDNSLPVSCQADPSDPPSNLCCYESPGVSRVQVQVSNPH